MSIQILMKYVKIKKNCKNSLLDKSKSYASNVFICMCIVKSSIYCTGIMNVKVLKVFATFIATAGDFSVCLSCFDGPRAPH